MSIEVKKQAGLDPAAELHAAQQLFDRRDLQQSSQEAADTPRRTT
jgi:hypothetical protein